MSRYDGLIIPRSYSEYINKTDAATLLQALQQSGVMDAAPTAGSNHPVKSNGVYVNLRYLYIEDYVFAFNEAYYTARTDYESVFQVRKTAIDAPITNYSEWICKTVEKKVTNTAYFAIQTATAITTASDQFIRYGTSADNITWVWQAWQRQTAAGDFLLEDKVINASLTMASGEFNANLRINKSELLKTGYKLLSVTPYVTQNWVQATLSYTDEGAAAQSVLYISLYNTYNASLTFEVGLKCLYVKS